MNRITNAESIDSPPGTSDGDLLRQFLGDRDDRAFAELVARHGSMVYGACLRRLGQCQDAEDCFQAVFLALATHDEKLVDGVTVGPWLYTVARQVGTKALRSRRRRRWVFWGSMPEPATKPPVEVDVDLDAALATLNEQEQSAIILCHLEGMSRSEAAQALGCPEGTLSARLSRALEKLRRKLGKPPLAVLAAATMVMLPEALPAAAVGLVRHLHDGTLDDWASPQTLNLYRKAVPMRLLDRFGPSVGAVIAAVLILVGAAFGWQIITAQQPNEAIQPPQAAAQPTQNKSFAAAVEEMQASKRITAQSSTVQLQIDAIRQDGRVTWRIVVLESFAGSIVKHSASIWPSIEPLLSQIAKRKASIDVHLYKSSVNRLEANQLVNICRRVGFKSMDYRGPELFVGRPGDRRLAIGDEVRYVAFQADLSGAREDLPDWTNGWAVDQEIIKPANDVMLEIAVQSAQGANGPAHALAQSLAADHAKLFKPVPTSDFAKRLDLQQRAENNARRTIQLTEASGPDIVNFSLLQQLNTGSVVSESSDANAFAEFLTQTVKAAGGGPIDVKVGALESRGLPDRREVLVNPLLVNRMLNAMKKAGVAEIHYWGQPIFTGYSREDGPIKFHSLRRPEPTVRLILQAEKLDGELPDDTNGWVQLVNRNERWIIRLDERDQFQEHLKMKDNEMSNEREVLRLAEIPHAELERELAKKPSLLRDRWRKSVEAKKAKAK